MEIKQLDWDGYSEHWRGKGKTGKEEAF